MDKKKIAVLFFGTLILLFIISIVIFLLISKDKEVPEDNKDGKDKEVVAIYDPEEELNYSKDSLLDTARDQINELKGETTEEVESNSSDSNDVVDKGKPNNNENTDYSNFFGPDNSKEINEVKKTSQNYYDDIDEVVAEVKESYKNIEKPVETELSKDVSSKLGENKLGLNYVGYDDSIVDVYFKEKKLFGITYNKKVNLIDEKDSVGYDEGNITLSLIKSNAKYYNLEDYSENLINLFKYAGLNETESETVYKEFKNMFDKDVKTLKDTVTGYGYYTEYKFILDKKVVISYEDSIVLIIIY